MREISEILSPHLRVRNVFQDNYLLIVYFHRKMEIISVESQSVGGGVFQNENEKIFFTW